MKKGLQTIIVTRGGRERERGRYNGKQVVDEMKARERGRRETYAPEREKKVREREERERKNK